MKRLILRVNPTRGVIETMLTNLLNGEVTIAKEIRYHICNLIYGKWSYGFGNWKEKPKFGVFYDYFDYSFYSFHFKSFWIECAY